MCTHVPMLWLLQTFDGCLCNTCFVMHSLNMLSLVKQAISTDAGLSCPFRHPIVKVSVAAETYMQTYG